MKIRVVIAGRQYDLAEQLPAEFELADGGTVDDLLTNIASQLPPDRKLPASCLIALGGVHLGTVGQHPARQLAPGDEVTIVAPVAGG